MMVGALLCFYAATARDAYDEAVCRYIYGNVVLKDTDFPTN